MSDIFTDPSISDIIVNSLSLEDQLKFGFTIEFSKYMVQKRKELGWTQAALAEHSGVNRITIAKLEKFQRTASLEVVLKILYALGMTIQFVDIKKRGEQAIKQGG